MTINESVETDYLKTRNFDPELRNQLIMLVYSKTWLLMMYGGIILKEFKIPENEIMDEIKKVEEEVEKLCEEGKIHPFDYMLLQTAFSMKAILQGMIQENDLKKLFKEDDDFFKKLKAIKTVDDFLTQF